MRVKVFTESPRDWRSPVAGLFVLLVLLLGISAPPVVWIDATGKGRSDPKGLSLVCLAANRQRVSYPGKLGFPYCVRRRST